MVVIETITTNTADVINSLTGVIAVMLIGVGLTTLLLMVRESNSTRYRRMLTDLYVSAKVKALALKDNLDLAEEFESYKSFVKKQRISNQRLDVTVEEELQEQIEQEFKKGLKKDKDFLNSVKKK